MSARAHCNFMSSQLQFLKAALKNIFLHWWHKKKWKNLFACYTVNQQVRKAV